VQLILWKKEIKQIQWVYIEVLHLKIFTHLLCSLILVDVAAFSRAAYICLGLGGTLEIKSGI